jgi:hypothetical protein
MVDWRGSDWIDHRAANIIGVVMEIELNTRGAEAIYRTITAMVLDKVKQDGEARFLRRFPDDGLMVATRAILKVASTSATVGASDWGGTLAGTAFSDFFKSLGPQSAGSALMARSLPVTLQDGDNNFTLPALVDSAASGGFVAEGQPGKVFRRALLGPSILPKKMLVLSVISRELAKRMNGEAIIRRILQRDAALSLDAALFSSAAVSAAAPAGLLNGVTATALAAGTDTIAMRQDLLALASVVAPIAGGRIVYVAAPVTAVKMAFTELPLPYPVLPSSALAEGTVIAVATDALAFAVNPAPDITVSAEAVLHMEADSPAEIVSGTGPTTAAPVQSMFQTDCLAIRMIAAMTWAKLHANAVAYVTGAGW